MDPPVSVSLLTGWLHLVDLKVILRVFKLKVGLFDKGRDLFKLVISVFGVVEQDSVEHFGEMAIQILGNVAADFLALSELGLDALESALVDVHLTYKTNNC